MTSILSIEARHTSYLRAGLAETPFPNPFDTPLDFVSPPLPFLRTLQLLIESTPRTKPPPSSPHSSIPSPPTPSSLLSPHTRPYPSHAHPSTTSTSPLPRTPTPPLTTLTSRANRTSLTFTNASSAALALNVPPSTPIYAIFLSGLMKVCSPKSPQKPPFKP